MSELTLGEYLIDDDGNEIERLPAEQLDVLVVDLLDFASDRDIDIF